MARSWRAPNLCQGLDPDREPDRGDGRAGAELRHESIVTSARHQRLRAIALSVQFEFEARVVIEAAAERSGEPGVCGVDAARGHEADAAFELIDRFVNIELGIRG